MWSRVREGSAHSAIMHWKHLAAYWNPACTRFLVHAVKLFRKLT
jgi:hypothetical protein